MEQLVRSEFIIVELVALVFKSVELETDVLFRFTLLKLIGRVVVELKMVEVPFIPKADDDAMEGNKDE